MTHRKSLSTHVREAIEERLESAGILVKVQIIDATGLIDQGEGSIHFEVDILVEGYKVWELKEE